MSDGENTTIIKRAAAKNWFVAWLTKWQHGLVRGTLYFVIAWLTPFVGALKFVGPHVILSTWTWLDWVLIFVECTLAGCFAVRVYIDQSAAKQESNT